MEDQSSPDAIAGFRQALAKYRECRTEFEFRANWNTEKGIEGTRDPVWIRRDLERTLSAEGLWVSGMETMFNLLTTNYKAQEKLVAGQLRCAESTARWTKWMAIIAAVAIVATAVVGLLGPRLGKDSPAPVFINYTQAPPLVMPGASLGR